MSKHSPKLRIRACASAAAAGVLRHACHRVEGFPPWLYHASGVVVCGTRCCGVWTSFGTTPCSGCACRRCCGAPLALCACVHDGFAASSRRVSVGLERLVCIITKSCWAVYHHHNDRAVCVPVVGGRCLARGALQVRLMRECHERCCRLCAACVVRKDQGAFEPSCLTARPAHRWCGGVLACTRLCMDACIWLIGGKPAARAAISARSVGFCRPPCMCEGSALTATAPLFVPLKPAGDHSCVPHF